MTLFGSKSLPVPWLTAFIEKDNFTLSPWIWEAEDRAVTLVDITNYSVCVCMCVCCYLSPNNFNPHLLSHIDDLWGVLNSWGWHLTHMNKTCVRQRN